MLEPARFHKNIAVKRIFRIGKVSGKEHITSHDKVLDQPGSAHGRYGIKRSRS